MVLVCSGHCELDRGFGLETPAALELLNNARESHGLPTIQFEPGRKSPSSLHGVAVLEWSYHVDPTVALEDVAYQRLLLPAIASSTPGTKGFVVFRVFGV